MTPQFSIEELRNFDRHHAPKYAEAVQKAREAPIIDWELSKGIAFCFLFVLPFFIIYPVLIIVALLLWAIPPLLDWWDFCKTEPYHQYYQKVLVEELESQFKSEIKAVLGKILHPSWGIEMVEASITSLNRTSPNVEIHKIILFNIDETFLKESFVKEEFSWLLENPKLSKFPKDIWVFVRSIYNSEDYSFSYFSYTGSELLGMDLQDPTSLSSTRMMKRPELYGNNTFSKKIDRTLERMGRLRQSFKVPQDFLEVLVENKTELSKAYPKAVDSSLQTNKPKEFTRTSQTQNDFLLNNRKGYTPTKQDPDEELNRTRKVMRHFEQSFKKAHGLLETEEVPVDDYQADPSQLVSKPPAPSKRLKVGNTTQRKRLQGNTEKTTQPRLSPQVPTIPPSKKETDFPAPAPYIIRKTIELIAMEAVMAYEKAQGRFPEDVSAQNLGYDIDSGNETEERLIEVKGIATIANPVITENEYRHLTSNPNAYLYIVQQCNTENPQLYIHHQLGEHHFEAKIIKYEIAYADLKREVDAQCNLF